MEIGKASDLGAASLELLAGHCHFFCVRKKRHKNQPMRHTYLAAVKAIDADGGLT
jgi:hypothetical protein